MKSFVERIFDWTIIFWKKSFFAPTCSKIQPKAKEILHFCIEKIEKNSKISFFEKCFQMASSDPKWEFFFLSGPILGPYVFTIYRKIYEYRNIASFIYRICTWFYNEKLFQKLSNNSPKLINAFRVITGLIKASTPNFLSSLKLRKLDLLLWLRIWSLDAFRSFRSRSRSLNFTSSPSAFHGQ